MQTVRYNGYPAMRIAGDAAPGYSTGAAWPRWSGWPASCRRALASSGPASRARKSWRLAGHDSAGFAMLAVFLCLAALYESWSIPLAVMLVVPLGVLGALLAGLCCAAMPTTCTSRWA
jgi:multidrug efflux pump